MHVSDDEGAGQVLNFSLEYIASKASGLGGIQFRPDYCARQREACATSGIKTTNIDDSGVEVTNPFTDMGRQGASLCQRRPCTVKKVPTRTFYYSNISPQIVEFNQKYWAALEKQVQTWTFHHQWHIRQTLCRERWYYWPFAYQFLAGEEANDGLYPTTNADGLTLGGLICPSYYYMALLRARRQGLSYYRFLVPHSELLPEKPGKDEFMVYAVSIKNLECWNWYRLLFCNLSNEIEKTVEATYSADDWPSW